MHATALTLLGLAAFATVLPVHADDAALRRCRAMAEAGARLACYDALPLGSTGTRTPGTASTGPAAPSAAPPAQAAFGLPPSVQPGGEQAFIDSQIAGRFQGWNPEQLIELTNGQVWRIADGSRAFFDALNPKVRIERGAFGAFYMLVEGINQAPRVRRTR